MSFGYWLAKVAFDTAVNGEAVFAIGAGAASAMYFAPRWWRSR